MPINYACVTNAGGNVVLQGTYRRGPSYKSNVQQQTRNFQLYAVREIFLDDKLKLVYKNMDQITIVIVATTNVDLQESGAFLDKFFNSIKSEILGRNADSDLEAAARPLQAANAEQKYAHLTSDVNNFIDSWNDNPANRSKVSTLFKELEKTKDVMINDLEISMERGQKVDQSLEKSENLMNTSMDYKRTSKKVERAFWLRKWKMIVGAIAVTIVLIFILYIALGGKL